MCTPESSIKLEQGWGGKTTSFPNNAQGFLYAHMPADEPWQVRLRLTSSDSAQSFQSGSDLLLSDHHTPWCLPLNRGNKICAALWKLLVKDGVSEDLVSPEMLRSVQMNALTEWTTGRAPGSANASEKFKPQYLPNCTLRTT